MAIFDYNQKYIVFDFETEGLNLHYSRPWQLSWLYCEGENIVKKYNYFIDIPDLEKTLDPIVKKLTHFDSEKYKTEKKCVKEVCAAFRKYLLDKSIYNIGQNSLAFDIYINNIMSEMAGLPIDNSYIQRSLDTVPMGRAYRESVPFPKNKKELTSWQFKILNDDGLRAKASLGELAKCLNVEYSRDKHHDAMYDVEVTWNIFKELKKRVKL